MRLGTAILILQSLASIIDASLVPRGSFHADKENIVEVSSFNDLGLPDRKEETVDSKNDMRLDGREYIFTREPLIYPSSSPSESPSVAPSDTLSGSVAPSEIPSVSLAPSHHPSRMPPTRPPIRPFTRPPIYEPTSTPTTSPTREPTKRPTPQPTPEPTREPSATPAPTRRPTGQPTRRPTQRPTPQPAPLQRDNLDLIARFAVIGDTPYTSEHEVSLKRHIRRLDSELEFLIHVGDIRSGRSGRRCTLNEFQNVASILGTSSVPVFIIPGDNEYQDCPNFSESWKNWKSVFAGFHNKWNTPFRVYQDSQRPENFYFIHKRVLYVGLNIVGGTFHDSSEWRSRLSYQWRWTRSLLNTFLPSKEVSSVVIIGHADPRGEHDTFFDPLKDYIQNEGSNVPFLYFNGDRHYFQRDKNFMNRSNFHRIMVEGGRNENPLLIKISVPSSRDHGRLGVSDIYSYRR